MRHSMLICLCGCLDAQIELPPAIEILGVSPAFDVPEDAPVTVAFSGPIRADGDWPIEVGAIAIEILAAETSLSIAPSPRWPAGETLTIEIGSGLRDDYGRPIAPATLMFSVKARPPADRPAIVRTPTPGAPAPLNLRWIAVALGEADFEPEASLTSSGMSIDLIRERGFDGVELFRLPPHEGLCRPLCPGEEYRIDVDGWVTADGPLGAIETSTVPDLEPPEIIATKVVFRGGQPWVEICAAEPVLVKGEAKSEGRAIAYQSVPVALERVLARPSEPLDSRAQHELFFEVEDLAGNRAQRIQIPLVTPPAIAISISELVISPLRDWNDSEGGDVPFDPIPGVGTVSEADEWVELVNLSEAAIDLGKTGLELRAVDGTPSVTPLAGAPALYFGDGGSIESWWPGEALVVRSRGAMSSAVIVEIADGDQIFDRVVIGEQTGADHAGGSPPNTYYESIARSDAGGLAWCAPTPGDPLPARDCAY